MAIDPRGVGLKRFLAEDPGGPVVMLNLLRFAEGGRDDYRLFRYAPRRWWKQFSRRRPHGTLSLTQTDQVGRLSRATTPICEVTSSCP
ncbi:hypothetical protein GCM10007298_03120 [Williamsia phyllosphaerae]|uniref:Uncharacterized protein n=1 Tax=Williamsia phyllosphaerae TaxID=885042 RepID=A0ABQ1U5V0_9NOCA|nr:hypothetical protein GCM10007298_03120 [Williamsia phyllosphaerae]